MTAPLPEYAILTNVITPYRLALHRRLDREIPQARLVTLYTHDQADQPWALAPDAGPATREHVVRFGDGTPLSARGLAAQRREYAKGGRIIRFLRDRTPAALLLCGYNDAGRLRVLRWCRRRNIPVFLVADSNVHADQPAGLKAALRHRLKRLFVSRVVKMCAGVMPCGTHGEAYFRRYGARPDRVFYVPYEPDYDLITRLDEPAIERTRQALGLDPARRRLVCCARLIDVKRIDLAVDAFVRLAPRRPAWDLVVIGDGPLRAALQARVPAGLSSRVRFTGFLGEQAQISAVYRASDVFVHPATYEPWGVVINESVAAGMAVVSASTVGAAGELVRDDVNGFLVPPGDLDALTHALDRATDEPTLQRLRAHAPHVLADWRRRGDPVEGVRRALRLCGLAV